MAYHTHSPWAAYLMPTVDGILYLALKLSIPSSDSTKCLNLPIFLRGFEVKLTSLKRKLRGFKKTYKFKKGVLGQISSICERTGR